MDFFFFSWIGFLQMIEVDIPQSLFEEQGRQLYGAQLLQIQVCFFRLPVSLEKPNSEATANLGYPPFYAVSVWQANMKLNEQQLASLSSPKAVNEYLESQRENITSVIKQNLAVGDIFRRENLQVWIPVANIYP